MSKASNRRCYFYDKYGEPIDGGCRRPPLACNYYHPEEEGWRSARIPTLGPPKKRRKSPSPPHHGYRRDSGYSRSTRRSRSRSRSRSSVRRTRKDSIASSSLPEEVGSPQHSRTSHAASDPRRASLTDTSLSIANKGPLQPSSSTSSATLRPSSPKPQKPPPPPPPPEASSSSSSVPIPPVTAPQAGGFGEAPFPASDRRPSITTMPAIIPTSPRALIPTSPSHQRRPSLLQRTAPPAPPPPPKEPMPMPPPPPLPAVPSALSAGVAPSPVVEQTVEERRAMWEERTRILSESELAREQLTTLEEQHVFALQIVESRYFASLPDEDKTRLKDQLAELDKQRDEAKKTYEESVDRLFKTGSWPIAPHIQIEEGVEENHKEVVNYVQELKDTALQMSKILGDISMFKSLPPLFLPGGSDDEDDTAMDVDRPDGSAAPQTSRKRRRISQSLDGPGGGSAPSMPSQEELDEFLERLVHMESLISTLQNDIHEHGRDARDEFEQLVDAKLDEFRTTREEEERKRVEDEQEQIQGLDQDITLIGEQMGELATEIGDLIMKVDKLQVDVAESRKGRQERFEKVLEVERRLQEYISTREANVQTIQTFEKALNAYTSRPPSPPATPLNAIPPFDYIIQSLEDPMVQALRSHLVPIIEELRKDIEEMVRTQNAELYSTLWNRITATLRVLEMIQSKINQGDIEPQSLAGSIVGL